MGHSNPPSDNLDKSYLCTLTDNLRSCLKAQPTTVVQAYPVQARYPNNYNPLVSPTSLMKLAAMNGQDFLKCILSEFSEAERESLMVDEQQRRKTFKANWPHSDNANLSGSRMAQAGFYYLNEKDLVQCVFCRGKLNMWESTDKPMQEHRKAFHFCRFVKGLPCGNRQCDIRISQDHLARVTYFDPKIREIAENNHEEDLEIICTRLGINLSRANYISYAPAARRGKTYRNWPASNSTCKMKLCDAGFYYTGDADQVRCFYCSVTVRDWEEGDDPWREHARWFPSCLYLVYVMGQEYIDSVRHSTPDHRKSSDRNQLEDSCENLEESKQDEQMLADDRTTLVENVDSIPTTNDLADTVRPPDSSDSAPTAPGHDNSTANHLTPSSEVANSGGDTPPTGEQCTEHELTLSDSMSKCIRCEERAANQLGLPCGHLALCGECTVEEEVKSHDPNLTHNVVCKCGSRMLGCMKVFF